MRGVIKAVHVLSPVESFLASEAFLHYDSLLRRCGKFGKSTFLLCRRFCRHLLYKHALAELIASNEHFGGAVPRE